MKSKTRNKYRAEIRRLKKMLDPKFPYNYGTETRVEPQVYGNISKIRKGLVGGSYNDYLRLQYAKESALEDLGMHIIKDLYEKGLIEIVIDRGVDVDYLRIRAELYLKR